MADLYDLIDLARANGFESVTDAITKARKYRDSLTLVAAFKDKTLIAPSFGFDGDRAYQVGASAAFNQAADIAIDALSPPLRVEDSK